jgi:purine nucleoside phosphorylase
VKLYIIENLVFCQRHAADPVKEYSPPHLINKKAIISAFSQLKVKFIIGFASVGTLKKDIKLGMLVIPDDFFNLWDSISFFEDKRGHIVPTLESPLRQEVRI